MENVESKSNYNSHQQLRLFEEKKNKYKNLNIEEDDKSTKTQHRV